MKNKKSQITSGAWELIIGFFAALLVLLVIVLAWPAIQKGYDKVALFITNWL